MELENSDPQPLDNSNQMINESYKSDTKSHDQNKHFLNSNSDQNMDGFALNWRVNLSTSSNISQNASSRMNLAVRREKAMPQNGEHTCIAIRRMNPEEVCYICQKSDNICSEKCYRVCFETYPARKLKR